MEGHQLKDIFSIIHTNLHAGLNMLGPGANKSRQRKLGDDCICHI
jgi:hypothetical protein